MSYQKPELFLVGAAQGLVLGADSVALHTDHAILGNCVSTSLSRNDAICD